MSQNRGYDPQKHREMSKPYIRTWCTLLVSWGLEVGFCATLAGVRYLHRNHPSHLPPGDVGRVRGATSSLKSTHERPQDAESAPIMGDHRLHILVIENEVVTEADAKV